MEHNKNLWSFIPKTSSYLGIIFVLVTILTYLKLWVGIAGFVLFTFLVLFNIRSVYNRRKEVTKYIENLTFHIDTATKDTLLNFPLPLVVLEMDGTIIWYNPPSRDIFGGKEHLENAISSFVEELGLNNADQKSQPQITKEITINDRTYNVLGNLVKVEKKSDKGEFILMLYFLDTT